MWHRLRFFFVLALLSVSLIPTQYIDAKRYGGYNSYSTYRSYNNNNYYRQQQTYRQNQAIQRQNQINAARQRQTQMRNQQQAARKVQMQQQRAIRDRQIAMQRQMKQRQQKAVKQQTTRLKLQRKKMLDVQKNKAQGKRLAKIQKNIQQSQVLREQRKVRERQKKLDKLFKKRNRAAKSKNQKAEKDRLFRLNALSSLKNNAKVSSFKPKTISDFKSARIAQAAKLKIASKIDKSRLAIKSKVEKANQFRKQVFQKTKNEKIAKAEKEKLSKTKKQASNNFARCSGGVCKTGFCSFHGDTLVKTLDGFEPIKSLEPGIDYVWSRDEYTGDMDWKSVLGLFSNPYAETVEVSIRDTDSDAVQTIISNRIHPFYVSDKKDSAFIVGTNATGHWVQAQNLQLGQYVLSDDELSAEVVGVSIQAQPLHAYNITVDDYHTYFVKASNDNSFDPVWVHNDKECNKDWSISKEKTLKAVEHDVFKKIYKSKSDGLWWSKDTAKHGNSHWKVFRETSKGLKWYRDADRYGNFIKNKHKSLKGKFIPWKQLKAAKI